MSGMLRLEVIVLSLAFFALVVTMINRRHLQMKYSMIWMLTAVCMLLIAVFPGIAEKIRDWAHIETTSNLVFLIVIGFLLVICFSLSVIVSNQSEKIRRIVQMVSVERYLEQEQRKNEDRKPPDGAGSE